MNLSKLNSIEAGSNANACLSLLEQLEVIDRSRLCLTLQSPDAEMTLEEKQQLYDEQKLRILNFVELLHDSLITEHGKVLLCLYQCD
jgi:hypothetical protein